MRGVTRRVPGLLAFNDRVADVCVELSAAVAWQLCRAAGADACELYFVVCVVLVLNRCWLFV